MANRRTGPPAIRLTVDPFPDRAPEGFKKMAQELLQHEKLRAEPWPGTKRPAKLVVEFPEIPKEDIPENSTKVNPDWVGAPYEIEFRCGPGVNIGPPPERK